MEKIAQFKREKQTKEKMEELTELLELSQEVDDEMKRELVMSNIDLSIQQAINTIREIIEEQEMIQYGRKIKMDQIQRGLSSASLDQDLQVEKQRRGPKSYSGPLLSQQGKVVITFSDLSLYVHL